MVQLILVFDDIKFSLTVVLRVFNECPYGDVTVAVSVILKSGGNVFSKSTT